MLIEIGVISEKRLRKIRHLTAREVQAALLAAADEKLAREGKTLDEIDHERNERRYAGFLRERIYRTCESIRKGLADPVKKVGLTGKIIALNGGYGGRFRVLGELPGYSDMLVTVDTTTEEYKFISKKEAGIQK